MKSFAAILLSVLFVGTVLVAAPAENAEDDILIAGFESETYGQWKTTGEAFGPGPVKGTLPGQMHVSGYRGNRLVNSFYRGDRTTGTLTSPAFNVERNYLTFLIGGGGYKGKTCINLLLNGKTVRTATGPNTQPGGSEQLSLSCWDVREFRGKMVSLEIVDQAKGGWGHINIDHIVLTDKKPKVPVLVRQQREMTITRKYLLIPISNGAKKTDLVLEVEGTPVRNYETELATNADAVDWYAYFTVDSYRGKSAKIVASNATEEGFALIRQADEIPTAIPFYTEPLRPQFHFSQKVGWNNDPNGMVYLDGEWHLFFQYNPTGRNWGNMTWGHAVSKDLIHWKQLPNALFPKTTARGACFSGGAVVDRKNSAGWKTDDRDVLVAFLTDTGAGESIAYSLDHGRTFTWYPGNPVVKHKGRDPKVIWYQYDQHDTPLNEKASRLGGHWVMAVYDEQEKYGKNIAFYTSTNLKQWREQTHLSGYYECPELFELPIDGDQNRTRWVVFAADARYSLGNFDGRKFTPDEPGKHRVHYGSYYASQVFSNAPDGRKIQIGWAKISMPGMPFNQTFSFPHQLTLRTTEEGVRLYVRPVEEIEKIHRKKHSLSIRKLTPTSPVTVDVSGSLFDIRASFRPGQAKRIGMDIGCDVVAYDVNGKKLNGADLKPDHGIITMQILVDRPMLEICGNQGRVVITSARKHHGDVRSIKIFSEGGEAELINLEVHELESIWNAGK